MPLLLLLPPLVSQECDDDRAVSSSFCGGAAEGGEGVGMDKAFISRSVSMRNACECNTSSSSRCRYELVECQIEYENANDSR